MESDKNAARDKVVNRACTWLEARNAKAALTGPAKEAAKVKQRQAENDLAEATEKYQKEK